MAGMNWPKVPELVLSYVRPVTTRFESVGVVTCTAPPALACPKSVCTTSSSAVTCPAPIDIVFAIDGPALPRG